MGVIVVATCLTAGWVITNENVNTDNIGWGLLLGFGLIVIGCFGYAVARNPETSEE